MSSGYQTHKNLGKCNVCPKNAHCATITLFLKLEIIILAPRDMGRHKKRYFLTVRAHAGELALPVIIKLHFMSGLVASNPKNPDKHQDVLKFVPSPPTSKWRVINIKVEGVELQP